MPSDYRELSPSEAWSPLPAAEFDAPAARHLLRRLAWGATTEEVAEAVRSGPAAAVAARFERKPEIAKPLVLQKLREDYAAMAQANLDEAERMRRLNQLQEQNRQAAFDWALKWCQLARQPENAAWEKFTLFLCDVFVVGFPKVRVAEQAFHHHELLRDAAKSSHPALAKQVLRSPAMASYLDVSQNRVNQPNENLARELFELFTLGEGNYSENEIKEAARALTGLVHRLGSPTVTFAEFQHDSGEKTIFGQKGRWKPDDVVDLAFRQPAAATFLPREFLKFYLSFETALEKPWLDELARRWKESGHSYAALRSVVFSSRLFYHNQFRGNMIKSPFQFHFGMLTDLGLDPTPIRNETLNLQKNMGQAFFTPPNVRGWVYGKNWINTSTLAARRQLVQTLFGEIREDQLNADDYVDVMSHEAEGGRPLRVTPDQLARAATKGDEELVTLLCDFYLPGPAPDELRAALLGHLKSGPGERPAKVRQIIVTLLQSPLYHLC